MSVDFFEEVRILEKRRKFGNRFIKYNNQIKACASEVYEQLEQLLLDRDCL